jgi:predicted HTH transcriptional regulator
MTIAKIIQQPEGRRIEFKKILPTQSDLNKTIVAFANDAGGELYIGIQDNPREVTGINEDDLLNIEEQLSSGIHDNCAPIIHPEISFLKLKGLHVVKVKIYKGSDAPYFIKSKGIEKGTYIRVGSSNRLADRDIITELKRQKSDISFDTLADYNKEIDNIDLHSFKKQFKEKTNESINNVVLNKLGLISNHQEKKYPTLALILLSDDELRSQIFPYGKVECARFKGVVPGNFIDQKTIDTSASLQAERAYQFVLRHISEGSEYEGVYRKDRWEYPIVAIREAIRNAIIHRDYSLKGKDIKIAIFDDKIEITSPGKLLPTVDFDEMEAGQSDIRNKTLAPVFKKLGIIEQWGNGLQLIADELKAYPEIELSWKEPGIAFRLSFIKKNFDPQLKTTDYGRLRTITDDYERLAREEQKILLYLLDNKTTSRKEAVKILKLQKTKVHEILSHLLDKKLIKREGQGRSTYYVLVRK